MCAPSNFSQNGTNVREWTAHYPSQYYPDANAFQRLQQQQLYETRSIPSRALVNVCHPQTVRTSTNKYAIISAVVWQPCRQPNNITGELGASQPRDLKVLLDNQSHPYQQSQNTNLFPDNRPVCLMHGLIILYLAPLQDNMYVSQKQNTLEHMLYDIFDFA
jgi:hypothetical protein